MAYTPSYPIPSKRDQAYILLVLAIGTVKRFFTELNSFNEFDEKTQDRLLDIAENIIHGKEESDKFVTEFEKALKKEVSGIKLDDNCKTLILQRLDSSKGSSRSTPETKTSTEKETNKKIDKKGTLKEADESYRLIAEKGWDKLRSSEKANYLSILYDRHYEPTNKKFSELQSHTQTLIISDVEKGNFGVIDENKKTFKR